MANLVWIEDGDSRQATIVRKGKKAQSTYTKSYKIFGTADDTVLHAEINSEVSAYGKYWSYPGAGGMRLMAESYSVSFLGDNAWQVTINYTKDGAEDGSEPLKRARSFDTTGSTQHITQAQDDRRYPLFAVGTLKAAPDQKLAIGVDSNGVNGVDIITPQLQWQEQYDVPNGYVSSGYVRALAEVTGTTNNASFRGFDVGEVLFVGCSGSQEWDDEKGKGPWSLSYRFVASKNVTGQTIGSISGIEKKGHEYLWVLYEDSISNSSVIKQPRAVYVSKVYKDSDFSRLGIGTGYV
jgi:hypothetical protein